MKGERLAKLLCFALLVLVTLTVWALSVIAVLPALLSGALETR